MSTIIIIAIFSILLALVVALIFLISHAIRGIARNSAHKISTASVALVIPLTITLVILGERLLYDIDRWFNPLYDTLPAPAFHDLRDTIRQLINIALGIGGIVSLLGLLVCGLHWLVNTLHHHATHTLVKTCFYISTVATFLIMILWAIASYTLM